MQNPPKLLIVLVMGIVLLFILGMSLGARLDGPIDTNSLKTAGQSFFGNQPFPAADLSVSGPASCRVVPEPLSIRFGPDGCVIALKDSSSQVRRLAVRSDVAGQSVGITLKQPNQITVTKTLSANDAKSTRSMNLDVFKDGGTLALTCTPGSGSAATGTPTPGPTLPPNTCVLTIG